jgi:tetratricopeptide (TPR) repeat protein
MKTLTILAISLAIFTSVTHVGASVPIIVNSGVRHRAMANLCNHAQDQVRDGDLTGAMRNVEAALQIDPKFWPALYVRAQIFAAQGKYQLAIQDCNEALRQYRGFIDASSMRAVLNAYLGKYAEALKELNYLVSIHPPMVTLARVLKHRAWLQATCPDASFRNGQQAVKDAKTACSITVWKDEDTIDTLAAAYAETGDFASAVQYAQQALGVKDISSKDSKRIQRHLELFEQRKPVRL